MQPGPWVRLPGVRLLQDAGGELAANGTPAFLVPVLDLARVHDGFGEGRRPHHLVAADVRRGKARVRRVPVAPQDNGRDARVRRLPPAVPREARGRHRPLPAGAEGQGSGCYGVASPGGYVPLTSVGC
ncbi:hypothetical protein PR202_gb23131 [Eleusine coracana subsp. coracana]|uniref:Uncharacterized protein n=1 Tax=Eleusine coracana subsp. coracana TaxID=191504 RepID=A0AAV5FFI7_ELECO|nr:hypothetical protein PR202_gb23131 [Eleusine coracana subsp. coracana]